METTPEPVADRPSPEGLVETGMLTFESLHPGGLELSRKLAELCKVQEGDDVLDVASGTGETACFLAERFAVRVYAVDRSDQMIRRGEATGAGKRSEGGIQKGRCRQPAVRRCRV